jgi:hypothetical protein
MFQNHTVLLFIAGISHLVEQRWVLSLFLQRPRLCWELTLSAKSRITRRKAKRPTSTKQAEEGVKAAQDVFRRFLEKADLDA